MDYIAGIDIGNATTETVIGKIENGRLVFCSSDITKTTGIKGTTRNVIGIINSIKTAAKKIPINIDDIKMITMNEATPVIGDFAMDNISETIITDSSIIGHNPDTPGGIGFGFGETVLIQNISGILLNKKYILVIPEEYDFIIASKKINEYLEKGYKIEGAIVKNDEGVLISNRISKQIPIIDEVRYIEKVPIGMECAVEVAPAGRYIESLSNPYGIATVFKLDSDETKHVVCMAKALIGNRSAVVIKTPLGNIERRKIPAGEIIILGEKRNLSVNAAEGAEKIMENIEKAGEIKDIKGKTGTNVGGMFESIRIRMADITEQEIKTVHIKDIVAVDTLIPKAIEGRVSNEFSMENGVGIAAMVKTQRLLMKKLAHQLSERSGIKVQIGGIEGDMAMKGALTTPGTNRPMAIVDIGAGSTDACFMSHDGQTKSVHLAGAGDMVSLLINLELGLDDIFLAEDIKKYPLAKVESLFHIRHEDGSVQFFNEPMEPKYFARVVILRPDRMIPIPLKINMEKIRMVRQEIKNKVFIQNIIRALKKISITGNIRDFEHVVLVGGSSLDFELPNMVTDTLSIYGIVAGRGNVRGTQGPRNAVATGLLLSYFEEITNGRIK